VERTAVVMNKTGVIRRREKRLKQNGRDFGAGGGWARSPCKKFQQPSVWHA